MSQHVHEVHQVEQRNRDWGYDTLDVLTDFDAAQRLAQKAADRWARQHDRRVEELFWTSHTDASTGQTVTRSWNDVFIITTRPLTFD